MLNNCCPKEHVQCTKQKFIFHKFYKPIVNIYRVKEAEDSKRKSVRDTIRAKDRRIHMLQQRREKEIQEGRTQAQTTAGLREHLRQVIFVLYCTVCSMHIFSNTEDHQLSELILSEFISKYVKIWIFKNTHTNVKYTN